MHFQNGLASGVVNGLQEVAHLGQLGREGHAQIVQQGLVVVEDLTGLTEGQRGLHAVVVHGGGHARVEVVEVDFIRERGDVIIQILNHVIGRVAGQTRNVDDAQRRNADACRARAGKLSVDVVVAADVLGVDLDVGVLGLERLDLLRQNRFVIAVERMPEGDFGGRVGRDGGVDLGKRRARQEHQRRENQSKQLFHWVFSPYPIISAPRGSGWELYRGD